MSAATRTVPATEPSYFAEKGALPWLLSLDHKRIALLQLVAIGGVFIVGVLTALLMRAEHLTPEANLFSAEVYARAFTLHGAAMAFAVLVPAIPATVGSFVLPLQIGARNLAFPRLNLASLHLWALGVSLVAISVHGGGADTGWTLLPPLSVEASPANGSLMAAIVVLALSALLRAVVLMATIHTLRAEGMTWRKTPPLAWSLYAHSAVTLVAAPVLILTLMLLLAERSLGIGLFEPKRGGDLLLYQHFFWFGAHGLTYGAVLPAVGIATEIIGAFSTRGLFGRRSIAAGIVGLAIVSLLAWGEHMPTSGHSIATTAIFGFIALLGLVPATHLVGSWLVSLRQGARPDAALLLALAFVSMFVLSGLAGLALGVSDVGTHLHGTAYVVGHSHLMLVGIVVALLAGIHFWWPKLTGTIYSEAWARAGGLLLLAGTLVAFTPQLVLGARGLPRRVLAYSPEHTLLQDLSSVGALVLAVGLGILLVNLAAAVRSRRKAEANPWQLGGLEWICPSPPPTENFLAPPRERQSARPTA